MKEKGGGPNRKLVKMWVCPREGSVRIRGRWSSILMMDKVIQSPFLGQRRMERFKKKQKKKEKRRKERW